MGSSDDDIRSDLERVEKLIASSNAFAMRASSVTPENADAERGLTSSAEVEALLELLREKRDRLKAQLGDD